MLVLAIIASSWWSVHLTSINATQAYYSPFTRFWELALGGLLVLLPRAWSERTPRLNAVVALVALVAVVTAALSLNDQSVYPGVLAWWPCGATAVLLWTGQASCTFGPATWFSWRPFQYVGNVSYSFYLWHYLWLMLPQQYATTPMSSLSRVAQVLAAFACAVLSYHVSKSHSPFDVARRASLRGGAAPGGLLGGHVECAAPCCTPGCSPASGPRFWSRSHYYLIRGHRSPVNYLVKISG